MSDPKAIKREILPKNILVVGDLMVDHYTYGKVTRISPEAPVPVVHVQREEELAGGAGNVMSNLIGLGMKVFALGRIGQDSAGQQCKELLTHLDVETSGLLVDPHYRTVVKNRVIAESQQIVRVDYEKKGTLSSSLEEEALFRFERLLPNLDAIAIADYDKGFCTTSLLQKIIQRARERDLLVVADPKGTNFLRYKGATLIKPNLSEALRAAKLPEEASLERVAERLLEETLCSCLMITRSEAGISLFDKEGRRDFPALVQEVRDVTGAGDTVSAVVVAALANRLPLEKAAILANKAASYVIQHVGCVQINLDLF